MFSFFLEVKPVNSTLLQHWYSKVQKNLQYALQVFIQLIKWDISSSKILSGIRTIELLSRLYSLSCVFWKVRLHVFVVTLYMLHTTSINVCVQCYLIKMHFFGWYHRNLIRKNRKYQMVSDIQSHETVIKLQAE